MKLDEILNLSAPSEFLDAIAGVGPLAPGHTQKPAFSQLPDVFKMTVLIRAFYIYTHGGDFGGFLSDSSCGRYVGLLKRYLATIGADDAKSFVEMVESEFPGSTIPENEAERFDQLEALEKRMGARWVAELTERHKTQASQAATLLAAYLRRNPQSLMTTLC